MKVILADDEKSIRVTLGDDIREAGFDVETFDNGEDAYKKISEEGCDVLICDLKMPGMDGISLLKAAAELHPMMKGILITGFGTVETAVEAMKFGAYDYVLKPFLNEKIIHMLENIVSMHEMFIENRELKKKFGKLAGEYLQFHGMIGISEPIQAVFRKIENIAPTDASVLIEGESGTGKELAARAVHELSARSGREMVVLSCAASPESLVEDELFGHEAGAYTGAVAMKKGKVERADGSTLFIDDIDDMSLNTQAKMIRVLQEHQFERVGGTEVLSADFRIIAASKLNLKKLVQEGSFREDLFFRLNIIPLHLPALRDRPGDAELLANFFRDKYSKRDDAFFSEETLRLIRTYSWPGNVRELENAVIRATALAGDREAELRKDYIFQEYEADGAEIKPLGEAVIEFEREYIGKVLKSTGSHRQKTADLLGISRKTLWEKMKSFGIEE